MATINTAYIIPVVFVLAYGNAVNGSPKVLLCTLTATSSRRTHFGNFTPEDLDPHLCTHIIYNFGSVDKESHDIVPAHPSVDLYGEGGLGIYNRTMKLKEANPQLKVVLQACCFNEWFWEDSIKTHDLIVSTFIKNAVAYLERYGFDGLFLTLDHHAKEQQMLNGLREEFDKRGFLLFANIFPIEFPDRNYFELTPESAEVFDYIIFGDHWTMDIERTQIFSPLSTLRKVISKYKQEGIPLHKLAVAIPTFAMSYKLSNVTDTGLSARIYARGREGLAHHSKMFLVHSEMMYKMKNASEGWVVQRDNETGMFYGHSNSLLWATYEDPVSVRAKAQFVLEENLAGFAMLTLEMDDIMGYNDGGVKLLLTRTAHDALRGN